MNRHPLPHDDKVPIPPLVDRNLAAVAAMFEAHRTGNKAKLPLSVKHSLTAVGLQNILKIDGQCEYPGFRFQHILIWDPTAKTPEDWQRILAEPQMKNKTTTQSCIANKLGKLVQPEDLAQIEDLTT